MLIGMDVGGTNTDAVLLDRQHRCLKAVKVPTQHGGVLETLLGALGALLEGENTADIQRVCVSSTLALNALLTGKAAKTGILALAGPGIRPHAFWLEDPLVAFVSGSQDHRGIITEPPDEAEIRAALERFRAKGMEALAVVAKFSPKNPELEERVIALARELFPLPFPIVAGSAVSGALNFPRRLHTAYCRAAFAGVGAAFVAALERALPAMGLHCPLNILKADAGAFSARAASEDTASSLGSGPAASLLGVMALKGPEDDTVMIDFGGTTADMAFMAGGEPLLARQGLVIAGRPTLIRSLWTHSVAVGGDASLWVENGLLRVGPERSGVAIAFAPEEAGLRPPTLTDALNVTGQCAVGDVDASQRAMAALLAVSSLQAGGLENVHSLSLAFVEAAVQQVADALDAFFVEINSRPLYTIREILYEKPLVPKRVVAIGGPALALRPFLEKRLGLPVVVPESAPHANAVGAALAKPTCAAELYADTRLGRLHIPTLGISSTIDGGYTVARAEKDLRSALARMARETLIGQNAEPVEEDVQVVFAETFHVVEDSGRRDRIFRVMAQLASGLLAPDEASRQKSPTPERGGSQ